jgi:hypothetical protein
MPRASVKNPARFTRGRGRCNTVSQVLKVARVGQMDGSINGESRNCSGGADYQRFSFAR